MSNFFAKLTGRLLTVVFGGKPKTITVKSEEEKQELRELAVKASQGDQEALEAIQERVTPQQSTNSMAQTLKDAEQAVEEVATQFKEVEVPWAGAHTGARCC